MTVPIIIVVRVVGVVVVMVVGGVLLSVVRSRPRGGPCRRLTRTKSFASIVAVCEHSGMASDKDAFAPAGDRGTLASDI